MCFCFDLFDGSGFKLLACQPKSERKAKLRLGLDEMTPALRIVEIKTRNVLSLDSVVSLWHRLSISQFGCLCPELSVCPSGYVPIYLSWNHTRSYELNTHPKFSALNSFSKNLVKFRLPRGSRRSSERLKPHLFTLRTEM